jgi:hypothetical protein
MKYALLAAGLLLTACATQPTTEASAASDRDCFRNEQISGFNVVGDNAVKISVGPSRDYLLTTNRSVQELRGVQTIALRSTPVGLICTGNGLGVELHGGRTPATFWVVTAITRAPEEAATAP